MVNCFAEHAASRGPAPRQAACYDDWAAYVCLAVHFPGVRMFRTFLKAAVACLFAATLTAPAIFAQSRQQAPPPAQPAAQQAPPSTDITHKPTKALVWLFDLVRI